MIPRIDLRGRSASGPGELRAALPRAELDVEAAVDRVRPICAAVREHGAAAVSDLTERFDGVRPDSLRVPAAKLAAALDGIDAAVRAGLAESARRARLVHHEQRRDETTTRVVAGGTVTQRWVPVARVGLYVPGGLAVYPSSVVMNVVPAQEAGVPSLAVASPPQRDNPPEFAGLPHPAILAACALLGVEEVYAVGGAQAIAMFAYGAGEGAERCEPVNLVTGPGNVYVAAAKRLLKGTVGIDAEAGPTEIAILADDTADPAHVAADLISQAEHDTLAAAVLVTPSVVLAESVTAELARQVARTKHSERITAALAGPQSGIVVVDDIDAGLAVVDAYAAEHLEIQTADAAAVAARVRNAGAVFVGPYAPVSLGDYCAGSNHVLPTGGCACHSSGLSVQSFLRGVQVIDYDRRALADVAHHVVALADAEDLPAHGAAVRARFGWDVPPATGAGATLSGTATAAGGGSGTTLDDLPIRAELRGTSPYGAPQLDVPVRLNTNENPYPMPEGMPERIGAHAAEASRRLNRYPDRDAVALRTALAAYLTRTTGRGTRLAEVWAANGSNEVLQQLLQAFGGPGRTAMGFEPSYSMHPLIARATGTAWCPVPRAADFRIDVPAAVEAIGRHRPDVVFLCSPNNPTGTALEPEAVLAVYEAAQTARPSMVVVDEAYAEFSHHASLVRLLDGHPHLVVTRTMSKAFGAAGLRLGYLAADPAVIEALLLVRLPYHLSAVAQSSALAALEFTDRLLGRVEAIKSERDRVVAELRALGRPVVDSDANFVLFGVGDGEPDRAAGGEGPARRLWQALLKRGVLVRDVGLDGWLRVTVGTPGENDAFLDALRAALT